MNANLEQLVTEVMDGIGNPLETEISKASVELAINKAIAEYSRYKPKVLYKLIELEKDKNVYDIPNEENVMDVICCSRKELVSLIGSNVGLSMLESPSLATIFYSKLESLDTKIGCDWEYVDGQIVLYRIPVDSGFFAYKAGCMHTVQTIPQKDKELIVMFSIGECLIKLARKRNKKVEKVPTVSGTISFDDGSSYKEEGQTLQDNFYRSLGRNVGVVVIG